MPLPTTRIRTCVLGQPVIPDDINEIQDAIIDSKQNNRWTWFALGRGTIETNVAWLQNLGFYTGRIQGASAGAVQLDFHVGGFSVGDRITDIGIHVANPAVVAGQADLYLYRVYAPGGFTLIGHLNVPSVIATPETKYTLALATPESVLDGYSYVASIKLSDTQLQAANFGYAKDRL